MMQSAELVSLTARAVGQMSEASREHQAALTEAGVIHPLVAMLGSPNSQMQANAAEAISALVRNHGENQSLVVRCGAVTPLCALVREVRSLMLLNQQEPPLLPCLLPSLR